MLPDNWRSWLLISQMWRCIRKSDMREENGCHAPGAFLPVTFKNLTTFGRYLRVL